MPSAEDYNFRRALFIQIKQAGDCLLSTPSIRAFKKKYPGCELNYLVDTYSAGILKDNRHIDRLITIENRDWGWLISLAFTLRKNRYDLVVDFLSNPTSSKLTYFTGAKYRVGYERRGRKWAYNRFPADINPDDYSAREKLRLLEVFGIEPDGLELDFHVPVAEIKKAVSDIKDDGRNILAVVPVSRRSYKCWPPGNFAQTLDKAVEELKLTPLLLCGPGEEHLLKVITSKMKSKPLVRQMESFQQFGAYLLRSKVFFGNDNGPKHIATALGIPTLAVTGHINPLNWTEPDNTGHLYIRHKLDCQSTCSPKKCKNPRCIEEITPEEVYPALKKHWQNVVKSEAFTD